MTPEQFKEKIESANPYPTDIFPTPTSKEEKGLAPALQAAGISSDRIFADFGRKVWANATEHATAVFERHLRDEVEPMRELIAKLQEAKKINFNQSTKTAPRAD